MSTTVVPAGRGIIVGSVYCRNPSPVEIQPCLRLNSEISFLGRVRPWRWTQTTRRQFNWKYFRSERDEGRCRGVGSSSVLNGGGRLILLSDSGLLQPSCSEQSRRNIMPLVLSLHIKNQLDLSPYSFYLLLLSSLRTFSNSTALRRRPSHSIPSPFANINTKPYDQRCCRADRKQEREPLPVVLRLVDDCLDNIRPDHGRSAVGKTKQTKEL